ncbi:hypothetical protein IJT93_10825 [bacterium]|nr:hypothetical protein [bacterium]
MNGSDNKQKKLLLIDGNGLAYRSFYALPFRRLNQGFPVNAVLGFINLLLNAVISERPTHIAVAFDHGAFVDTLMKFQSYNVQREEMLDDLADQLPVVEDFVQLCGIKAFRLPGFEADDCIATLAAKASQDGFETLIVAGDLELMQLVSPHVKVMTMRRGIADAVIYDEALVKKKYNLRPAQLADLRALAGDSSQNIGGVPGIGEVTAKRLLSQYSSLTELFDSLGQLPAKWRNPLSENRDDAFEFLSRSTIRFDLPLHIDWQECEFKGFPVNIVGRVLNLFQVEGFGGLIKYMERFAAEEGPGRIPLSPLPADNLFDALQPFAETAEDISAVWLADEHENVLGLSLSCESLEPVYIDFTEASCAGLQERVLDWLKPVFADKNRRKFVLNFNEIIRNGIEDYSGVYAVDLLSELLFINSWDHSVESVCARFGLAVYDRMLFGACGDNWENSSPEGRMAWTSRAADILTGLGGRMLDILKERKLEEVYFEIEIPLAFVSWHLNHDGIGFDEQSVEKIADLLDENLKELKAEFLSESGLDELDLDSEEEVKNYLFEKLSLLVPTRPKNGSALSAEMLRSLQDQNPIVEKIRCHYELSEFKKVFVGQFMKEGRLNAEVGGHLFNLALPSERRLQLLGRAVCHGGIETMYRMVSSVYNLEYNVIRRPLAQVIDSFLRPRGVNSSLIFLSFPAMALYMYAEMSGDSALREDLASEKDVEKMLLEEVFGDFSGLVGARNLIVDMLFFVYSPAWLARRLSLSEEEGPAAAEKLLRKFENAFSKHYPVCWDYILRCQSRASAMEDLTTAAGRFCVPFEAGSRNYSVRENAERFARAMPAEGSCADIFRKILVSIYKEFGSQVLVFPCGNIIVVCSPKDRQREIAERCRELCLQSAYGFDIKVEYTLN